MDNPEKLATLGKPDEKNKTKTLHNMCWTPLHANKHRTRTSTDIPIFRTSRRK
jgi:hypothetical protein